MKSPDGYLVCNGATVSRETYSDLFAVIGTTFGSGEGSTTFNLPNLIGKGGTASGTVFEAKKIEKMKRLDDLEREAKTTKPRRIAAFSVVRGLGYAYFNPLVSGCFLLRYQALAQRLVLFVILRSCSSVATSV